MKNPTEFLAKRIAIQFLPIVKASSFTHCKLSFRSLTLFTILIGFQRVTTALLLRKKEPVVPKVRRPHLKHLYDSQARHPMLLQGVRPPSSMHQTVELRAMFCGSILTQA